VLTKLYQQLSNEVEEKSMARIIPGVQVTVVKEVVPPQLAPSGVLGLIGLTEKTLSQTERASSWSRFLEVSGSASAYSIPEARLALANGVYELVIVPLVSSVAAKASFGIDNSENKKLTLEARAAGIWANGLRLKVSYRIEGSEKFDLEIKSAASDGDNTLEVHRNLDPATIVGVLEKASSIIRVDKASVPSKRPSEGEYKLIGGTDATAAEYSNALEALKDEPDVDLVLAAVQDFSKPDDVTKIYSNIISHCQLMSADSKGRIGIGHTPPNAKLEDAARMASTLLSDRFVLLAPFGVAGAVAGRIGGLEYYQSPTFKTLSGLVNLSRSLPLEEQGGLLKANVVPIVNQKGRGVIVLRGLTTDGDQISVRRVADRAVRGARLLGELFIGRLNNEDGRGALKQKLTEFLAQMEKEGALVPSTDGKDSAFKVDVYSSQADFAQGIVRVDIAVRPVRAIDFIYATIFVQV
jgi:phage tail sheath protein FI